MAGERDLILPQMIKTGAVVVDVGISRLDEGQLVRNVDIEGMRRKASYMIWIHRLSRAVA